MKTTSKPTTPVSAVTLIDDANSYARRATQATNAIASLRVAWPGLRTLDGGHRADGPARGVLRRGAALEKLFVFLATPPRSDPAESASAAQEHQRWQRVRSTFDILGHVDNGVDPSRLEVERVAAELARVRHAQQIADDLEAMARAFRDDAIATASTLVEVSDKSLELTRTLAGSGYHYELAGVIEAMRDIAAPLRRSRPEADEEAEGEEKGDGEEKSEVKG